MNTRIISSMLALALGLVVAEAALAHWQIAPTPPMGWNSWDCFGTTLTEQQAKEQADAMARQLKPLGWTYLTVDIQWYEPHAQGHAYKEGAPLAMDEYSRLLPALTKFPSATNGAGFKALADYVHAKGLKFGIHIMRGIPRQAVRQNTPLLGTSARASEIANQRSRCAWNPDMFGVDLTRTGAQAYYDSLFQLYATWGVDLVKVDDIARPYDEVQRAEIEAIRKAIDKTGRPIVLSLSPGDTPIQRGAHVMSQANMWRISDDFWDRWQPLYEMFGRLDRWTQYRAPGAWPDADMLPFGIIEFKRPTKFTKEEQVLCMTLWCIARSPLILGADMTKLDEFTLNLLTNPEVLAVNQSSAGNRQLSRKDDLVVWTAEASGSPDRYVALFNAQSKDAAPDLSKAVYRSPVLRGAGSRAEISAPVGKARRLVLCVTDAGDGFSYDHAVWVEPTLSGPKGNLKLTDLRWKSARAGWGEPRVNRTCEDRPLLVSGAEVEGIGTHAVSVIVYDLPEGYDTFRARGALTQKGSVEFAVLADAGEKEIPDRSVVSVSFADLGLSGKARVRDLWKKEDLGVFSDRFNREIPLHGAGLYRVSPQP
jgi:hypothetical protein